METHYGLVLENERYIWSTQTAYAVRDVAYSFRWLNQQLEMNRAQSVEELDTAGRKYLGIGWLNTFSADSKGHAHYADRSAVPRVTNEQLAECVSSRLGKELLEQQRLPVMDGWRAQCEWGSDEKTPVPGIFGPSSLPQLARTDYVANSNGSYWVNNLSAKLEGFPLIMGAERTAQTLRTRMGLAKIERRKAGQDGYPGNKFTLDLLERITMDNRVLTGELWRDEVIAMCRALPANTVGEACEVLAKWDLSENLDSPGAVLWRRFFERLSPQAARLASVEASVFTIPFDPNDPMNTPRGLNTRLPEVTQAFTGALADLRASGMALDATYRKYQLEERAGVNYAISGGYHGLGQYNLIHYKNGWVAGKGWPDIILGSSFMMWMQFTPGGPVGRSILTYSQSNNPDSKHHADQTQLFSAGRSKPIIFTERAIESDPNLEVKKICIPLESVYCRRYLGDLPAAEAAPSVGRLPSRR